MDRPAHVAGHVVPPVDHVAEEVEDSAQGLLPHRDGDRAAGVDHLVAATQAVGRIHRDGADAVVAEVLLDLADEVHGRPALRLGRLDPQRVVDLGKRVTEEGVDHDARDLLDRPDVSVSFSHASP